MRNSHNKIAKKKKKVIITQLKGSKGPKQTSSQRRHINGQQVYEKVLNITSYQGNVNPNHNKVYLTPSGVTII
jgi:hypothetical protein